MLYAVFDNDLEKLKSLIGSQSLSKAEAKGYVLLRTACKDGCTEIAKYLLSIGCCVNSKSSIVKPTKTPLHHAAKRARVDVVEMLVSKGALVDALDGCKQTPLYCAVHENHENIVGLLLSRGSLLQINECFSLALKSTEPNIKIIQMLVNYGASVNSPVCENRFQTARLPIQLAASCGNKEIFLFLLAKGADINAIGNNGETLLHVSAEKGHLSITEHLVKQGASVNSVTLPSYEVKNCTRASDRTCPSNVKSQGNAELGYTALHLAVLNNKYDVIKFLLDHGGNIDDQEKNGKTALHIAVEEDYDSVVELLLSYHPDVNNDGNKDVLIDAVFLNRNNSKIVQYLFDFGFSIDSKYRENSKLLLRAVEKGQSKVIEELFQCGAEVKATVDGVFLLHSAVRNKYKDVCEVLLNNKADVNLIDGTGNPPLHYAVENMQFVDKESSRREICELLVKNGADVNFEDKYNRTPIVYSIKNADYNITKLLFDNGATIKENIIESFNTAIIKGCLQIVELILERDENFNLNAFDDKGRYPLHCTALTCRDKLLDSFYTVSYEYGVMVTDPEDEFDNYDDNRNRIAKLLLLKGADVNSMTNMSTARRKGYTSLFAAAKNGFKKVVETLLKHSADVNGLNCNDCTALHVACSEGHVEIVDILLKSGADLSLKCVDGLTALHYACAKDHGKIVDMLVESPFCGVGCTNLIDNPSFELVNCKDRTGLTPLMFAAKKGFQNVAEILLNFSADVNASDNCGKTALHWASETGHLKLISLLLKFGGDVNSVTKNGLSPLACAENSADEFSIIYGVGGQMTDVDYDSSDSEYVEDHGTNCYQSAYSILINHIRKLSAADLYLSDANFFASTLDEIGELLQVVSYYSLDDCRDELNTMKKYFIDKNVSYHDLVTKSIDQLAVYARIEILLQSFNSCEYDKMFPIYSDVIHSRFRMGIKRNYLLEETRRHLCSVNSDLSIIPYICIEKMLSYLSDDQLKSLIEACKPSNFNCVVYKF